VGAGWAIDGPPRALRSRRSNIQRDPLRRTVLALVAITIVGLGSGIVGRQAPATSSPPDDQPVARQRVGDGPTAPRAGTPTRSPRNANYTIDVRLDHAARRLTGRETVHWRNITDRPTRELQLHLYWNAWRDTNSTWLRERHLARARAPRPEGFGSIDISALRVRMGRGNWDDALRRMEFIAPDDSMFQRLTRGRAHLHKDLTREVFEATLAPWFAVEDCQRVEGASRWMYVLRRRA